MSRVYDALRQWDKQSGAPLRSEPQEDSPEVVELTQSIGPAVSWEQIAEFVPSMRAEDLLVSLKDNGGLAGEKFRLLQSRLGQLFSSERTKMVLVTSAVPEDGKSMVAANLAISLAKQSKCRTLLLEGDFPKATLANRLGLAKRTGLAEWMSQGGAIEGYLQKMKGVNLWILPAGHQDTRHPGVVHSPELQGILTRLRQCFDWIIVDSPPLLPLADTGFWAQQSDGVLLVIRRAHTPRLLLQRGLEIIDSAKVLGVVLNDTQPSERSYYNKYYRSYYKAADA
jgi:capsular exopolysaccharide synthesis family protein